MDFLNIYKLSIFTSFSLHFLLLFYPLFAEKTTRPINNSVKFNLQFKNNITQVKKIKVKKKKQKLIQKKSSKNIVQKLEKYEPVTTKKTISVQTLQFEQSILQMTPPKYPKIALRRNLEGWVSIKLEINQYGNVEDVLIVQSSGQSIFEKEALNTARTWKFKPYNTSYTLNKKLTFKIED